MVNCFTSATCGPPIREVAQGDDLHNRRAVCQAVKRCGLPPRVDVCPVDCIYTSDEDNMYYIHPEECIDCRGVRANKCPVVAIFAEEDTPPQWDSYIDLNYEYFEMSR